MRSEHLRHQSPDAAGADNDHAWFVGGILGQFRDRFDPPCDDAAETREQRGDRQADRSDDLPELRGARLDQQRRTGGREDDQRRFRRAGHQDAGFRCGAAPCPHQSQQDAGDQRLERQDQQDRGKDQREIFPDRLQVDAHAHGDQEDPQREALERLHDGFDFAVIFGLRDQQPGDQRADDWREADRGGGEAGADDHQQRCGEKQFGALGARGLAEQPGQGEAAENHHRRDHQPALPQRGQHAFPAFAGGIGGHRAEDEDDRHDHDVFEQQHRQRRASDGRMRAGNRQDDGGGGERQREAERERAGPVLPHHRQCHGQRAADHQQLHRA